LRTVLLIGLAGGAGAMSRYAAGVAAVQLWGERFVYGTLLVNVVGSLLLGLLLELDRRTGAVSHTWRMLLGVGFLGAFTTFSAFGYETLLYLAQGTPHLALLNVAANLVLGLGAVWVGWVLARAVATV
jgi:CrcB protein